MCFYLRIVADEEARIAEYLSQRDQVVNSSEEFRSEDTGTESEYNDSNKDNSTEDRDNNSVVPPR